MKKIVNFLERLNTSQYEVSFYRKPPIRKEYWCV